ncbi:MAG: metal ABC transporter ATP-binding protein [Sphingobacteriia bacterium]|nr:metal ABC transporter ATP-binding protein [Sphingobacteriia bacterium]
MNIIELTSVSLKIKQRKILENISFTVKNKEIVTIIGPNGSGKTSLVKIIVGIIDDFSGKINKLPNLNIGYLPQKFVVKDIMPITVRKFINAFINDLTNSEVEEIIKITNIKSLLNTQVSNLSGGELQKVLLARALVTKPNLLVLDEPAQAIDIPGQIELYNLLGEIREKFGISILLVSHDLHIVMKATDKVICINNHICCSGKPEDVSKSKEYLKFIGDADITALSIYEHHHDHRH